MQQKRLTALWLQHPQQVSCHSSSMMAVGTWTGCLYWWLVDSCRHLRTDWSKNNLSLPNGNENNANSTTAVNLALNAPHLHSVIFNPCSSVAAPLDYNLKKISSYLDHSRFSLLFSFLLKLFFLAHEAWQGKRSGGRTSGHGCQKTTTRDSRTMWCHERSRKLEGDEPEDDASGRTPPASSVRLDFLLGHFQKDL